MNETGVYENQPIGSINSIRNKPTLLTDWGTSNLCIYKFQLYIYNHSCTGYMLTDGGSNPIYSWKLTPTAPPSTIILFIISHEIPFQWPWYSCHIPWIDHEITIAIKKSPWGYITPEIAGKFPGYLSPSAGLKFADVPNGLAAISKVG